MEFFLFLLYNQESSREKYFPAKSVRTVCKFSRKRHQQGEILSCKERRNKHEGNQL